MIKRRHEMGVGGDCFCPKCDKKFPHKQGIPCQDEHCPDCDAKLLREGSYHHELLERKRADKMKKED